MTGYSNGRCCWDFKVSAPSVSRWDDLKNRPYWEALYNLQMNKIRKEFEMTTYLMRFNGENFMIDGDDGPGKRCFTTTRLIEADNKTQAELLARELIEKDPRLQNIALNKKSDPPVIHLESATEVPAMAYDAQNRANSLFWEDGE